MDNDANLETGADSADELDALADFLDEEDPEAEEARDGQSDADEESSEEEADEAPSLYTVKVNGEEKQVTLDDLIAGYQMESDYRHKTADLAEQRRAVEAERQATSQERGKLANQLNEYGQRLQFILNDASQIDWNRLIQEDPQEALRLQVQYQRAQQEMQEVQRQQADLRRQAEQDEAKHYAQFVSEQQEKLLSKLPEWKDSGRAEAEKAQLRQFLTKEGYSAEEIGHIADHRTLLLARKAWLFDQLMAKRPEVQKKVQGAPTKVEKTTQAPAATSGKKQALQQATRRGGVDLKTAAKGIEALL